MTTQGIKTIVHPVTDLDRAKKMYSALLGMAPTTDSPYYVGFETNGQQIGLAPKAAGQDSSVAYWHVDDINAKIAEVTAAGGTLQAEPKNVGGGRLVATFTDPDGNVLGLIQDA